MDDRRLTETAAKRLLTRAIELDAHRGDAFSIAQLRDIAAEAGVSPSAFERAVTELDARRDEQPASLRNAVIGSSAAGVAIGGATGLVDVSTYFIATPIAMGVVLMVCGALGMSEQFRSPVRGLLRYAVRASVVWIGYASTWALAIASVGGAGPVVRNVMVRTTTVGVVITTIFGLAVAGYHAVRSRHAANFDLAAPVSLKHRIANTLKRWIDNWANRVGIRAAASNPNTLS